MGTAMRCRTCSGPLASEEPFCPHCGTGQDVAALPTGTAPRPRDSSGRSHSPRPSLRTPGPRARGGASSPSRFVSGVLLSERYRIVELLGRGGMGEVYRADDLVLDQSVALKFLPLALQDDPERRERFYDEVRLARQIAHPSVCRVYDVMEVDGTPFLSMEYVDGEDMASLLRRIGRLPIDKALEIARQLCAGVAAAHEKGVLHRDLKPENVMLDGRGHVRITDFGLAVATGAVDGTDVRSGTPAYMSPEQLAGLEVTVRSDVYALGLVLYELFTGRKAFEARSLSELQRKQREDPPAPSDVVPELDPAVERAILRCLEREPARRPSSALAVSAALPGGDPLAAALAAGETPSPELVAAAGTVAGLRASSAWAMVGATAFGLVTMLALSAPVHLFRSVPLTKSPAVLEDRARELLQRQAPDAAAYDSARGYFVDDDYIKHVTDTDRSTHRWAQLASGPPVLQFWYRQAPRSLITSHLLGRVMWTNPPPIDSGMAGVRLDPAGRLVQLYVVPPQLESGEAAAAAAVDADWSPLFGEAGLDLKRFHEVTPLWTPANYVDRRRAWEGVHPDRPDLTLRVEAGSFRGRPVWFQVLPPWARAERMVPFRLERAQRAGEALYLGLLLAIIFAAALLARRHVTQGRGDMAGARRLARYMVLASTGGWLIYADHVFDSRGEMSLAMRGLGASLLLGLVIWTLYLALEPYVRRRWPEVLIGWTRLLAGRWRDPLVARDVLIGCTAGALMSVVAALAQRLPAWLGHPAFPPSSDLLDTLLGPRDVLAELIFGQPNAVGGGLGCVLVLLMARRLVPNMWGALALGLLVLAIPGTLLTDLPLWVALPIDLLLNGISVLVLVRYGLLAGVVMLFVVNRLLQLPLTSDLSSWSSAPTVWVLGVMAALCVYGFRTALAGRPAFRELLPD